MQCRLTEYRAEAARGPRGSGAAHLFTPAHAPAVLHLPEIIAVLLSVPHSEDSVVEGGAAFTVEDAGVVQLQGSVCADGDGDRLGGDRLRQGAFIILGDIFVAADGDDMAVCLLAPVAE